MAIGLLLAILIDQRVRGESVWRTIYLYPLAVSFVVTGTVWSWLFNPTSGIEFLVHRLGWTDFKFAWTTNRDLAIYTIVITGIWQASGLRHGALSRRAALGRPGPDQGGADRRRRHVRIYRRIVIPAIGPIFIAVMVVLLQFAIKTFDLAVALTNGGPGIATTFPAIYVYDLMFQRGQIAEGAAAAIMILLALAVVLVPYSLWRVWRRRVGAPAMTAIAAYDPLATAGTWRRVARQDRRLCRPRHLRRLVPAAARSSSSSTRSATLPEIAEHGLISLAAHASTSTPGAQAWSTYLRRRHLRGHAARTSTIR